MDIYNRNGGQRDYIKDIPHGHISVMNYCVLRVGTKYYNLETIEAFEYHMERLGQVDNADRTKSHENRILIGDANIYQNLKDHIKEVWMRSDSVIARDMILTASQDFMRGLSKPALERWLNLNVEWLKETYGKNILYCVAHFDETTPHLHCLISPVYISAKGIRTMSNKHYFDGRTMLSALQTNYSEKMQTVFKSLNRGLKGSKSRHVSIRQYYNMVNKKLDEKDIESVMAKARNNELLEITLNDKNKTLNAYKNYQSARDQDKNKLQQQNTQLYNNLKQAKKDNSLYINSMKTIAQFYKIPEQDLVKILKHCKNISKETGLDK